MSDPFEDLYSWYHRRQAADERRQVYHPERSAGRRAREFFSPEATAQEIAEDAHRRARHHERAEAQRGDTAHRQTADRNFRRTDSDVAERIRDLAEARAEDFDTASPVDVQHRRMGLPERDRGRSAGIFDSPYRSPEHQMVDRLYQNGTISANRVPPEELSANPALRSRIREVYNRQERVLPAAHADAERNVESMRPLLHRRQRATEDYKDAFDTEAADTAARALADLGGTPPPRRHQHTSSPGNVPHLREQILREAGRLSRERREAEHGEEATREADAILGAVRHAAPSDIEPESNYRFHGPRMRPEGEDTSQRRRLRQFLDSDYDVAL